MTDVMHNFELYQPATLAFVGADGAESEWEIKIRTRGKYRRRICDQPPIKLNFDKKELEEN